MKVKVFVFAILFAAAAAVKFDSSRCAHGPEYWCQHRNTAEECGAVRYCQDNVWPKPGVTADMCTDCKNFFGDVQNLLQNTTVQQMIVSDIKMICADLGPYADQCNTLVDQYGTLVLGLLASQLDPTSVCGTVGFCSSKYFKSSSNMCSDCDAFFGDVQGLLKNTTVQEEIENMLVSVCQQLGIELSECSLITVVGPEVFDFLASELDPKTVCTAIKFCQSSLLQRYNSVKMNANDQCADCKAFFGDVEAILKNQTLQNEIVQDVLAVCNYLGQYQEECKIAIQGFLPSVLTQLAGYMDPNTACPAIGFCPSSKQVEELKTNEVALVDADMCTDCKNFFTDVKTVLMNSTNQDIIIKALKSVCADLGSFADQCSSYVDQYGSLVINLVVSALDADTICNDIGFCSASGKLKLTGDMCADCEAFFGDVQTLLENTTVQAMITNELKSLCSLLGSEADDCKNLIDSYASLVFGLIASELDPKTACTAIQFCSGGITNTIRVPGSDMCSDCKAALTEIDSYLNDPTMQKELLTALEMFCTSLGDFEDECKMLVQSMGPEVIAKLAELLEPDTFCSAFGFCSSQRKMVNMMTLTLAKPISKFKDNFVAKANVVPAIEMSQAQPAPRKLEESTICTVCELVVNELDRFLSDNATEDEIISAVEKVCDQLPSAFKTECNALVSQYGAALIELLVQKIKPDEICMKLNLCTGKENKLSASTECTLCEFVMTEIKSLISDNSTDQEILNALEKVCSLLPATIQDDCNDFVDKYAPDILSLLKYLQPDQVCTALGLCTGKAVPVVEKKVDESIECVLCEFVMKELESLLTKNSTEQEILDALDKVCSLLPTSIQDDCNNFIATYGPLIFELLKSMPPDAICAALQLCGANDQMKLSTSGGCLICEFILKELDNYLKKNSTEEEIIKALEQVCNMLPSTISADCVVFVHKYGDAIIELLLLELDPSAICTALTLCTDTIKHITVSSEETCDLCKVVVMYADKELEDKATIQQVINVLSKVCGAFNGDYKTKCESLVLKYGAVIPEVLAQLVNPTKVCQKLKLCQSSNKMLGENECTFGPAYWCDSMENAQKCNAVVHCKNHVWN
ncbi:uncharacterized protein LOC117112217 [Anneissia japonica]|uniref:uncharacterized protein LOC117112217 n=1 Tax=Anneissia japonica TaxID=1529436 RepID=UPI001425B7DB|nr:uncharacterized protein LOC117112217 [Anneissia japonica]